MSTRRDLEGKLISVPFGQSQTESAVRDAYRELHEEYGPENVLVLTGSPTSMDTFEEVLGPEVPGASVPRVSSLVVHATDVVNAVTDEVILSDTLRRELVHRFLADKEWESEYFEKAAELESFAGDVAQLMETATWQDATLDSTPELIEVEEVIGEFQAWLADHGHIERGQLLSTAIEQLGKSEQRDVVVDVDAILAVEFEEFFPLDRRYLAALTTDLELVCVRERASSVRRTGVETGPVTDYVSLTDSNSETEQAPASRPAATARYLATGDVPDDPERGAVTVLSADSGDEQFDRIADEIERLREVHGWQYDSFAVATGHGTDGVSDAIHALTQAGIPTESTTVTGFGDDPAIRELLEVTRYYAAESEDEETPSVDESEFDTALLSKIRAEEDSLADVLRRWATASGLKDRIATQASPLDARSQFGNVRRVFSMAEFIEDTEFVEASWPVFVEMLERAHEHADSETRTSATNLDGGVRVDRLESLKNGSWRAVFVPDVVDQAFPGDPFLTRLFPQDRVVEMPDFPGVTDVTGSEVASTFQTQSTASSDPLMQYHVEQSRRRLAVGANAASERLYFCLYDHESSALDEKVQPSRFLTDAYRQLPWIQDESDDEIRSERRAEEFVLSRIDRALADVRRTQSRDMTVALDDLAGDLGEIHRVLDESGERGEAMRDALQARVDFAAGRVRRD
ncbi:DEAD/DEAH box helicase [Haloarcula laminariae]|uniref:DNA helicase UvrD n=1 Tax=Haloarcula laminariae TaxID=2961577 RepID=UPI002405A297|nr:DNA helicase UvrD [Halomicroarcula sp. FL173]